MPTERVQICMSSLMRTPIASPLVVALSTDDCATWSGPRVVTNPSRALAHPSITAVPDKGIFVVWDEAPDGLLGDWLLAMASSSLYIGRC